jgi:hypothetical protein
MLPSRSGRWGGKRSIVPQERHCKKIVQRMLARRMAPDAQIIPLSLSKFNLAGHCQSDEKIAHPQSHPPAMGGDQRPAAYHPLPGAVHSQQLAKKPNILVISRRIRTFPKIQHSSNVLDQRGVIHSYADGKTEDTGPLTKKRMETVDEEFLAEALDFIDCQHKADKPLFCHLNSTRMHIWRHLKPESEGAA